jgi:hypothetical protein
MPTNHYANESPGQSIVRGMETLHLRIQMANMVFRHVSLTKDTKTVRFVKRHGFFKGLAAMYERWVLNQKSREAISPDLDPLLPSVASVDEHQLPKELVDSGMTYDAAIQVSKSLSMLSRAANERMVRLGTHHPIGKGDVTVVRTGNTVKVTYVTNVLTIGADIYMKLQRMWKRSSKPGAVLNDDIFCVLQRYETLSGASPGNQMALPDKVFIVLRDEWGVSHECFASPLNCHLPSFCSLFPDTDTCFGSKGSFFDFRPTEGSFEANPPFMETILMDTARHISHLLTASASPLSFVFVAPAWDDSEFYTFIATSPYLTGRLNLESNEHFYKYGMQHRLPKGKRHRKAEFSSFIFFLQNEAGASRWPVTNGKLSVLRQAFMKMD